MSLKLVPDDEDPHTLTPEQYGQPVKTALRPVPALAWITSHDGRQRLVDAVATAWTPRAVRVTYTDQRGVDCSVWVRANAVRRWEHRE
jgi:hypothetical protein